jgi:DNA (cytosine-5)-methyltransferase 1
MWNRNDIYYFRKTLLDWYDKNKREFPWRKDDVSNYEIIVYEILLQRTKAETVAKYHDSFFRKYPGWEALCKARIRDLERVLKPFGLYNHRAKRLYKIIQEYKSKNGVLPRDRHELNESNLSTLYISNAFELFILNHRSALIDVNMSRVLSRFFNPQEFKDVRNDKPLQDLAYDVINVKKCKELNWAILDYAALVCKKKPACSECKLKSRCRFFKLEQDKGKSKEINEPRFFIRLGSGVPHNPEKPIKVVSLFSGCGGMDLGFEGDFIVHKDSVNEVLNPDYIEEHTDPDHVRLKSTVFQTVFANDILHEAKTTWVNYFKNKGYTAEDYYVESIVDLVKLHKEGQKVFPDHVDIVTGGFPCQDFSQSGLRNGFESHKDHLGNIIKTDVPSIETRGQLYMWMKEVVEITKPNIFIAENVKGLVNLSNLKEIIQRDFANANSNGYLVLEPMVLHAANYGVPQSRERVIFIGIKKSALNPLALSELSKPIVLEEYNPYPKQTHSYSIKGENLKPPVKLSTVFNGLPEPEDSIDPSQMYYSQAKFMGRHCQGQTEVNLESIGPTIRSEHHGNIEFRRLSIENGGRLLDEIKNKKLMQRRLTPRECALIQTFPPDYEFVIRSKGSRFIISASAAYKLIGNAVPPLLAYHVAKRIEKLWDKYFNQNINGSLNESRTGQACVPVAIE